MKIVASVFVNAPVEKVFNVFADIVNSGERITGIEKIEILSDIKQGVGTKWRETRTMFGKQATEVMEITELVPNQSYTVEASSHGTHYITVFTFVSKDEGTEVTMDFSGKPLTATTKFFFILMTPISFLFNRSIKKALEKDMIELKEYIEAN